MDKLQELLAILLETRTLLLREDNDFVWSGWDNAAAAVSELDGYIAQVREGVLPKASLDFLFLPTASIQEVSVSSGWGNEFLEVAERYEAAVLVAEIQARSVLRS